MCQPGSLAHVRVYMHIYSPTCTCTCSDPGYESCVAAASCLDGFPDSMAALRTVVPHEYRAVFVCVSGGSDSSSDDLLHTSSTCAQDHSSPHPSRSTDQDATRGGAGGTAGLSASAVDLQAILQAERSARRTFGRTQEHTPSQGHDHRHSASTYTHSPGLKSTVGWQVSPRQQRDQWGEERRALHSPPHQSANGAQLRQPVEQSQQSVPGTFWLQHTQTHTQPHSPRDETLAAFRQGKASAGPRAAHPGSDVPPRSLPPPSAQRSTAARGGSSRKPVQPRTAPHSRYAQGSAMEAGPGSARRRGGDSLQWRGRQPTKPQLSPASRLNTSWTSQPTAYPNTMYPTHPQFTPALFRGEAQQEWRRAAGGGGSSRGLSRGARAQQQFMLR